MASAIILFAHGAREPAWARPFERLQQLLQQQQPQRLVELAYLDCMTPTLEEAAARVARPGVTAVTVIPVFMSAGRHLQRDLPVLLDRLRAQHPGVTFRATPAIGETEAVLLAMADWINQETGGQP